MLKIHFEVLDECEAYSGWELGHVYVEGSLGSASSREMTPPQLIMIFPSIVNLLDGLRHMLLKRSVKKFEWVGADSSFVVLFERKPQTRIAIVVRRQTIELMDEQDLAREVFAGVNSFLAVHAQKLYPSAAVYGDLAAAVDEFGKTLAEL